MLPSRSACFVAIAAVGVAIFVSPRVDAGPPSQTVIVKNGGATAVRVRVFTSESDDSTCATGHQLYLGAVHAGEGIEIESGAFCVCAEQTYADTDDAPWTVPSRFCRPQVCAGYGRSKSCEIGPDPVIRIHVDDTPGT
jgi:hypothetical protein